MKGIPGKYHFQKILVNSKKALTFKYFHGILVDILKTKLGYLWQIYLERIMNELEHVANLVAIGLLNEDLGSFSKFLLSTCDRVLVSGLDQRDDYAGRIKSNLASINELYQHFHNICLNIWNNNFF